MAARGILSNPALFAGYEKTPLECIQKWLNITSEADTDITFQAMHHHLTFMAESLLSRQQRVVFNNLSKDKQRVLDFFLNEFDLKPHPYDYPARIGCTFDDTAYQRRVEAMAAPNDVNITSYHSESTDGTYFTTKAKDWTDNHLREDVDYTVGNLFDE